MTWRGVNRSLQGLKAGVLCAFSPIFPTPNTLILPSTLGKGPGQCPQKRPQDPKRQPFCHQWISALPGSQCQARSSALPTPHPSQEVLSGAGQPWLAHFLSHCIQTMGKVPLDQTKHLPLCRPTSGWWGEGRRGEREGSGGRWEKERSGQQHQIIRGTLQTERIGAGGRGGQPSCPES